MQQELWQYLKEANKPIVLYGMGNGADKIISVLEEKGIAFKGVFASDEFVRDKIFHGHKIKCYASLKEELGEMIVLLSFGTERQEVLENIKKIANDSELYAPDVPVVGTGLFDSAYLEENRAKYDMIYNLLADELSKKTFENVVNYKITGDIKYLLECEVSKNEPYDSFLRLSEKETFLDLGAYNGDTVTDFVNRVKDYNKIIALEPDIKTFKKLEKNTSGFENIVLYNALVSDTCESKPFSMKGGRNSLVGEKGDLMKSVTVDSLKEATKITFIKMDVEGEEVAAIKGAEKTIKNQKPKMLISAYHRTEDLFAIPEKVLAIRDDYKLYLRHFPSLPAWDINYYFV